MPKFSLFIKAHINIENDMDDKRIEMMKERCVSFKKWIEDWMMPAAGDFYLSFP